VVETLNANHRGMCKFEGADDDNYKKVHAAINGYLREIKETVGGGLHTHTTLSEFLRDSLEAHSNLDLTSEVVLADESIRACGGHSDVYLGRFSRTNKLVAIKQLRIHIQQEEQLSNVSTLCFPCSMF
jgi:hypothetical protein